MDATVPAMSLGLFNSVKRWVQLIFLLLAASAFGYAPEPRVAFRTNSAFLQSFNSDPVNQLQNITRAGPLTVAGSVTNAVTKLSVNSTNAELYSDGTFATATGIALHNNNNMFITAGSNAAGQLVVSSVTTSSLPISVSFQYDLNGNLLSDGLKAYEYDDFNQLTAVSLPGQWRTEFVYDGLGRRRIVRDYVWTGAWSRTNETRYICDGVNILQERDSNNVAQVTYTRGLDISGTFGGAGGIGGLLALTQHSTNGSQHFYYHSDIGGNITSLTDSSGNVAARYLYDPYGNLLGKWGGALADANMMQFSSMPHYEKPDLHGYAGRFYSANLQRWLNQDPIGERGGHNLHGFTGNNPIDAIDPLGLWWWDRDLLEIGAPQLVHDLLFGDRAPQTPADPNSLLAQRGINNDMGGEPAGQVVTDIGKAVPSGMVDAAMMFTGAGEEKVIAEGIADAGIVSKIKSLLGKCRIRNPRMHHPWPQYLGGPYKQELEKLSKAMHDNYHGGLDKLLPRQWGSDYYRSLPPEQQAENFGKLLEYTRKFDEKNGTHLVDALKKTAAAEP